MNMTPHRFIGRRSIHAARWWWRSLLFAFLAVGQGSITAQTNPAPANPDREEPSEPVRVRIVRQITNEPSPGEEADLVVPSPEPAGPVPAVMPLAPGEVPDAPQPPAPEPTSGAEGRSAVSVAPASPGNASSAFRPGDAQPGPERRSSPPGAGETPFTAAKSGTTSNATAAASAQAASPESTSSAPTSANFASFKVISDRNIFDPNRTPRRAGTGGPARRPKTVESFSLVGTMSYEKGDFAFFDGTSSNFRKALKANDSIAGYKIVHVGANTVKLSSGQKQVELKIGSQLRREEEGEWTVSNQAATYANTPATSSSSTTKTGGETGSGVATGADNDVLKRLMQRREKE
jgi:hypothetical protein